MIPKTAKDFKPSNDMISAARSVLLCMAHEQTVRPIVEGYQKKILAYMQAGPDPKWCNGRRPLKVNDVILEPARSYLLSDKDFKWYLERCNEERIKAGLKVDDPEYCPLLVAQDLLSKARRVLIDAMQPLTGVKFDQLFVNFPTYYDQYIDICLKLLAPYVGDAQDILKGYGMKKPDTF